MTLDSDWQQLLVDDDAVTTAMPMLTLAEPSAIFKNRRVTAAEFEALIEHVPHVIPLTRNYWNDREEVSLRRPAAKSAPKAKPPPARRPSSAGPTVHRLEMTLRDVRPPISRRLEIGSDESLAFVSRVLIEAMGWANTHLHYIRVGHDVYGVPDDHNRVLDVHDEQRTTLAEIVPAVGSAFELDYDFGDDWEHRVTVEAIVAPEAGVTYPRCLAGKRACPPEDCGGAGGYEELLEALADPGHPEHHSMMAWSGPLDPNAFDVEATNRRLQRLVSKRPAIVKKRRR